MLTTKQLAMRSTGIGASECAVAAGLSPFATPFDLYNSKVMGIQPAQTDAMRAGSFLEDGVAKMYQAELAPNTKLRRCRTRRHPTKRWMFATIDREVIVDGKRTMIVEIKLPGSRYFWNRETGERDLVWGFAPDAIPAYVACQAQWQMEITGCDRCDVVAFFLDSRELAIYPQVRNQSMIDSLIRINERFWYDHVVDRNPPSIDGSVGAGSYLKHRFPKNENPMIAAPADAEAVARSYILASRREKEAKDQKDECGNQLRAIVGANDGVVADWGKVTWKLDKHGRVDYQALAGALRSRVELLAAAAGKPELAADLDDLVEQHRGEASRVLRVTYKDPVAAEAPQLTVLPGGVA